MTGEIKIKKQLVKVGKMSTGEANAAHVYKGFEVGTQENGWHVQPFGQNAYYVGKTIADALETIEMISEA